MAHVGPTLNSVLTYSTQLKPNLPQIVGMLRHTATMFPNQSIKEKRQLILPCNAFATIIPCFLFYAPNAPCLIGHRVFFQQNEARISPANGFPHALLSLSLSLSREKRLRQKCQRNLSPHKKVLHQQLEWIAALWSVLR